MEVVSIQFLILVFASVAIYHLLGPKYKNGFLLLASLGFISTYSYYMIAYIIAYATMNFILGKMIHSRRNRIRLFRLGVFLNLLQLILIKYYTFLILPIVGNQYFSDVYHNIIGILFPIGISYFTLQGIGYLINIKMGWEKPENNYIDFFLYIVFFPKFLSGPIERSNHFLPQIKEKKSFDQSDVIYGMRIALFGLFKKVAIANQLAPYVFDAFSSIQDQSSFNLALMFLLIPIYLYYDFSGYTDIAIGFSRLFGFRLLPNFNRPFFADSMTEFWKRFHISLASWFNDYIFKQTVFRRRKWGKWASIYGLTITFLLFGIWHGAGWTFMILGLLQVVVLTFEYLTKPWRYKHFSKIPSQIRLWVGRLLTYLFYCLSLIFFFAPDLNSVILFINGILEFRGPIGINDISMKPYALILYIPLFLSLEFIYNDHPKLSKRLDAIWLGDSITSRLIRWTIYSIVITIIFVVGLKAEQFVYVNF